MILWAELLLLYVTVQPECCVERRTHGRDFFAGRRQREHLSRFSVLAFGGGFLAECRYPRGNGHGCPFQSDAAWMPLEDDRSLRHTFPFCLETSSRKKRTENRDRQFRCCRPLKKLTHGRPPPNTTFRLNRYHFIEKIQKNY